MHGTARGARATECVRDRDDAEAAGAPPDQVARLRARQRIAEREADAAGREAERANQAEDRLRCLREQQARLGAREPRTTGRAVL